MMKRCRVWSVCLLAWIIGIVGAASAESTFDALCESAGLQSSDVIAWIEIAGAEYSLPVMQHPEDDVFYSSHDAYGKESEKGALFTQISYNAVDFSDPVTVIYGGSATEGAVFRNLQEIYSGSFDSCREILLHLPEEIRKYEVFAAIPYSAIHILHYYDFSQQHRFESFFNTVYDTRELGMHLVEGEKPEAGDHVLILSTGLRGDKLQRYLVMAKQSVN